MTNTVATLSDVARRAGVSRVVASAVINGARTSARVSPATRERVLDAARELRYAPNVAAQSLKRPGMSTLGVAFNRTEFTFIANPYIGHILQGIVAAATAADFNVTLFTKPWIDAENSAALYRDRRTDGLIVIAPFLDSDMVPELAGMGLPMVLISTAAEAWTVPVPAVNVDNVLGARLAAQHLLALGHRRIGFVSGDRESIITDAQERRTGFLSALAEAGTPVPDDLIVSGNFNAEGGYAAANTLLAHSDPPTALFAANDFSALGVIKAAQDRGLTVPEQLSVIGFDDVPAAATTIPSLTTVRAPYVAMGSQAVSLLIARIAGEAVAPITYLHEPELIPRGSTAPQGVPYSPLPQRGRGAGGEGE